MTEETSAEGVGLAAIPHNWKEALPDELRSEPMLERFNDVPALAKALVSAQRMVGADKIAIPAANDREAWGTVYDRLGRPRSADGYDLERPATVPGDFAVDGGMVERFRTEAHRLGLSADQATGLYRWFLSSESERLADVTNQIDDLRNQNEGELKETWGGRYDEKAALAIDAARMLLAEDDLQRLAANGYTSDPVVMRLLAAVGERVVEGRVDGEGTQSMGRSPAEARSEIERLHTNQEFIKVYQDRVHPDHQDAVARMSRLYEQAYPGGTTAASSA